MVTLRRIFGRQQTPYLTRFTVGTRLRIHYFHRPDEDPDPHDHAHGFWTFPLRPYIEEVWRNGNDDMPPLLQIVPALQWTYREATHRHRVLTGRVLTIVWRDSGPEREWFFYRNGITPVPWREYLHDTKNDTS